MRHESFIFSVPLCLALELWYWSCRGASNGSAAFASSLTLHHVLIYHCLCHDSGERGNVLCLWCACFEASPVFVTRCFTATTTRCRRSRRGPVPSAGPSWTRSPSSPGQAPSCCQGTSCDCKLLPPFLFYREGTYP